MFGGLHSDPRVLLFGAPCLEANRLGYAEQTDRFFRGGARLAGKEAIAGCSRRYIDGTG